MQSTPAIEVESLTKTYGSFTAVNDLCFTARAGRVTGFQTPNGAGKSTAMRVVLAPTRPTRGGTRVLGRHYTDLTNPGREVGVLLDASAQHAGRTGREVLAIAQQTLGMPRRRIDEMLELVSLDGAESRRRVANYSLGMRQRLGIAAALIGDPEVLILDEPANGLDPSGIRWMRDLLRGFADGGGAVLLSSHLLNEIEAVADDLVLIGRGRIVAQGSKDDLLAGTGTHARADQPEKLAAALLSAGHSVESTSDLRLRTDADTATTGQVALRAGVALTELKAVEGGLEDMFLALTADTRREGTAA